MSDKHDLTGFFVLLVAVQSRAPGTHRANVVVPLLGQQNRFACLWSQYGHQCYLNFVNGDPCFRNGRSLSRKLLPAIEPSTLRSIPLEMSQ